MKSIRDSNCSPRRFRMMLTVICSNCRERIPRASCNLVRSDGVCSAQCLRRALIACGGVKHFSVNPRDLDRGTRFPTCGPEFIYRNTYRLKRQMRTGST